MPPRPLAPWAGVRAAAAFGPRAAQLRGDAPAGAEDCLTLNVWTPSVRAARRKPVLVWVHGGSFTFGAGDEFPGPRFARHDSLVVVSLNYRLGSLGFLQLSHLLGPAYRQSGNAGLLDAVAALRWVRANIAAFGGDPARVTLMGQSAGAKLIAALLVTPTAAGLFQQVILESGGLQAVRDTATAAAVTARLLSALQLRPDQAGQLLTLPLTALLRAQQQVAAGPAGLQCFGPVQDGATIPPAPVAYLTRPGRPPVRALVGTNRDEAGFFVDRWPALRAPNPAVLDTLFGRNGDHVWRAYERARRTQPADQAWLRTTTDYLYRLAVYRLAGQLVAAGQPVWLYRFDYCPPGGPGPVHNQELPYAWNALGPAAGRSAAARALARDLHRRWVAFIATGVPGADWPAYDVKQWRAMVFDSASRAGPLAPPAEDRAFPRQAFRL